MKRRINVLAALVLIAFGAVALSLTYWAAPGRAALLSRPDNLRVREEGRALIRGTIFDRDGVTLAHPVDGRLLPSGKPAQERHYPFVSMTAVTGYLSTTRGASGAEAAYDAYLRGANLPEGAAAMWDRFLNRPKHGQNIRLTVDADLQAAIAAAMTGHKGAVVVIEVPSGAIRAMYSAPLYDPNTIERDFLSLRSTPTPLPNGTEGNRYASPLYNRAVEVPYRPGGVLQTVIWAAWLASGTAPNAPLIGATLPMTVAGSRFACIGAPGQISTLREAYAYACPFLFSSFTQSNLAAVLEKATALGLGFTTPLDGSPAGFTPDGEIADGKRDARAVGVGQAGFFTTPMHMVRVVGAVANSGINVTPYLLEAVEGQTGWETVAPPDSGTPIMTGEAAMAITDGMALAVSDGAAKAARIPNLPDGAALYGHASAAIGAGGPSAPDGWFIGFIRVGEQVYAVAVVVEGADPAEAARIGGESLRAAGEGR